MSSGFDAFVGNPPWVSYAGRAAQPLDEGRREYFAAFFHSFAGYKNLQGVFIERCASQLQPQGRLGLVVPSSMSEQAGYGPSRSAHDRLCACDEGLPDLGENAFAGVFQPCMVLHSTRRPSPLALDEACAWPVERPDLDASSRALIARMSRPPLPAELFGERGLQSAGEDMAHVTSTPGTANATPLRVGGDIQAFRREEASLFADSAWFGSRLRSQDEWREVRVLIRQTARVPIAVLSDGLAFRNSILAGFEDSEYPAAFLVAYLNSNPIRWLHYMRHRDARQGMPQMKIGHLRVTPTPPMNGAVSALAVLGAQLSTANAGIEGDDQAHLDTVVADAFSLSQDERTLIARWVTEMR